MTADERIAVLKVRMRLLDFHPTWIKFICSKDCFGGDVLRIEKWISGFEYRPERVSDFGYDKRKTP